ADDEPDAAPHMIGRVEHAAEPESERSADWPYHGATDEMDDRKDAAANALGRIFGGIGEAERLFGAETQPGDEATDDEQRHVRRKRAEDREHTEQQKVELIDEAPPEAVAELALSGGADEHAEDRGAADCGGFSGRGESGLDDVGDDRAQDSEIHDIEEITGGGQRDHTAMQRRNFRVVERRPDKSLDCLGHLIPPPPGLFGRLSGSRSSTVKARRAAVNAAARRRSRSTALELQNV